VNFAFGRLLPQLSYLVPMAVSFIGYIGLAGLFCRSEMRELISIFDRTKASHLTRVNDEATLVSGAS
jgi:hypothetical protein